MSKRGTIETLSRYDLVGDIFGPRIGHDANGQYLDRDDVLAALDGEWQSERPAAGDWWVAIHPNQRAGCKKTVYEVWVTGADEVITRTNCVHRLEDEIFTGALWQLRTVPADPFKKETNHE